MITKRKLKTCSGKPDIKGDDGLWVRSYAGGFDTEGFYIMNFTISGGRWADMIKRCKPNSYTHLKFPSYIGCENKFKDFGSFVDWSLIQEGYLERDDKGSLWQLDKDLISKYNKDYSEDTCVFIPGLVNRYLISSKASRGDFPVGVVHNKVSGKYQAYCSMGKSQFLGAFNDAMSAHRAWQLSKITYGKFLNREIFEGVFPRLNHYLDLRVADIERDYKEGVITNF